MDLKRVITVRILKSCHDNNLGLLPEGTETNIEIGTFTPGVHAFTSTEDRDEWERFSGEQKKAQKVFLSGENSDKKELELLRAENRAMSAKMEKLEAILEGRMPPKEGSDKVNQSVKKPQGGKKNPL